MSDEYTDVEREWMTKFPGWKPKRDSAGMGSGTPVATVPGPDPGTGGPETHGSDLASTGKASWTGLPVTGIDAGGSDRRSLVSQMTRIEEYHGTKDPDVIVREASRALSRARNDADQLRRLHRVLGL